MYPSHIQVLTVFIVNLIPQDYGHYLITLHEFIGKNEINKY